MKSLTRRRFHSGEAERLDQRRKQGDVAHSDLGCSQPVVGGRFEREREHLRIGRRLVVAAERFDPGLHELAAGFGALAEDRADIAEARRPPRCVGSEVVERHGYREIGAQAEFATRGVADEIHAAADVLAREREERLGRLQDFRADARIACPLIGCEQRIRAAVFCGSDRLRHRSAGRISVRASL